MKLEEIRKEAIESEFNDLKSLSLKITELKNKGVSFLGCIAFVQINKNISLKEAQKLTLKLDAYSDSERRKFNDMYNLMLSEFKE